MSSIKKLFSEKSIHLVFDISLWLKAVLALAEIAAGIATYFISQQFLIRAVMWMAQAEFAEDPHDQIVNYLLQTAQQLSVGARDFATLYLLGHGIVKLWLIIGLLRKRLWYYPTAMVVFGLFIVYQVYRYTFTHSILLLLITALDLIVIALTWHEYQYLKRHKVR